MKENKYQTLKLHIYSNTYFTLLGWSDSYLVSFYKPQPIRILSDVKAIEPRLLYAKYGNRVDSLGVIL